MHQRKNADGAQSAEHELDDEYVNDVDNKLGREDVATNDMQGEDINQDVVDDVLVEIQENNVSIESENYESSESDEDITEAGPFRAAEAQGRVRASHTNIPRLRRSTRAP
jgi:predicted ATPase